MCINSLITSLLVTRTPDEVQLILIDPKQVEMSQYRGLPHLRLPVVNDMERVVAALRWTVLEMERRYTRFSEVSARNIVSFNERFPEEHLGYLVIVIDELADLMMTAPEDVERLICRLAQLGRAAGVHLVVATQRPSVDVLTGLIKANLPTRIAFAVSSMVDSRVILDRVGAERLLGRGDALYQAGDEMNPRRVQGAFAADDEIEAVVDHWRAQGSSVHTEVDEAELERLARQEDPEEKLMAQARAVDRRARRRRQPVLPGAQAAQLENSGRCGSSGDSAYDGCSVSRTLWHLSIHGGVPSLAATSQPAISLISKSSSVSADSLGKGQYRGKDYRGRMWLFQDSATSSKIVCMAKRTVG